MHCPYHNGVGTFAPTMQSCVRVCVSRPRPWVVAAFRDAQEDHMQHNNLILWASLDKNFIENSCLAKKQKLLAVTSYRVTEMHLAYDHKVCQVHNHLINVMEPLYDVTWWQHIEFWRWGLRSCDKFKTALGLPQPPKLMSGHSLHALLPRRTLI